jgi:predicted nucleic acid-binding protein
MNDVSQLQFVDTNILIYAHDRGSGPKHLRAKALIQELWESGSGCLSIQVLQEFYVNVTREVAQPLTPESAAQIIGDLSVWSVHRPSVNDVLYAIRLQSRFQLSFWDAMIVASALQLGCQVLWSEDLNPAQVYEQISVVNPFASSAR